MADGEQRKYGIVSAGTIETTNDDPTILVSTPISSSNISAYIVGYFLGQNLDLETDMVGGVTIAAVTVSGGIAVVDDCQTNYNVDPLGNGYTAEITANGADEYVSLTVTGCVDINIRWFGYISIMQVEVTI